ncbi:helix-turn-helix protein [Maritimibacter alkaliphilus HTCC2654]|jgi:transcriptional regulator with XRE-family HTH domain|uniref:DNA-binding protein, putative n=1 Tax=Maritimibacter alkaliphilus HTCC2654 TaxID=314271 RepID=A3VME3_9RHOB|nr:helix-turn-helix transcriptional regulator [Maritimibacter alkaliphilus]EAQ10601.1 DNA-binding protein, putative [Rhodobacterales bacterium HTCC2654] [Maritimibacter alkaliphilus HTCC2654]TYP81764.1 helix-turn-helix protein [Maritimibacter alkaliphilus HTCC2654]
MDDDWYSEDNATFGDRLAGAREAAGLTQKELAKKLGIKTKTLASWENDVSEPRANRLQMVSGLLSVSLGWLLTGEGEGVDPPGTETEMSRDARALLLELREVQADITDATKRMARLEKGLRKLMEDAGA